MYIRKAYFLRIKKAISPKIQYTLLQNTKYIPKNSHLNFILISCVHSLKNHQKLTIMIAEELPWPLDPILNLNDESIYIHDNDFVCFLIHF